MVWESLGGGEEQSCPVTFYGWRTPGQTQNQPFPLFFWAVFLIYRIDSLPSLKVVLKVVLNCSSL